MKDDLSVAYFNCLEDSHLVITPSMNQLFEYICTRFLLKLNK